MRSLHSSIKEKLMRIVLVTSGVVLSLVCISFFTYEFLTYRKTAVVELSTLGDIIAANSTAALAFENQEDAEEILSALQTQENIKAAVLYNERGEIFARYPLSLSADSLPATGLKDRYVFSGSFLEGFHPVTMEGKTLGWLYLKSDMNVMYKRFAEYSVIVLSIIAVSVIVGFLLSRKLQRTISKPIVELAETAAKISFENDYTVRAKKYDDDEIGMLTDAFNLMLTQIEKQNAEITSLNRALEIKVSKRTHDLEIANNELKLKNEFVETIIDSIVDVIAVFDRNLHYVVLNKYGKEVYNIKEEEIIGKHILKVYPQIEFSPMYANLLRALDGEFVKDPYYKSRISDRILENYYIPLRDKDGIVYSILVIGRDITEIISANDKLRSMNEQLEKSNMELEQFAYVASHDLQEPLRKIQTYSEFVERNLGDKGKAKEYLNRVISSAARMTDLIKAVLNYSSVSKEHTGFQEVDLNKVIKFIESDLELVIKEKHARLIVNPLPKIYGNELQIGQLFLNLISNALKFSKNNPEIFIFSPGVGKNGTAANGDDKEKQKYAQVLVKDNGIGFDQQYADKIFKVFQRLHNRKDYPGTGIGLALCKKIIDNHNGFIEVASKLGEGTTFKIFLPTEAEVVVGN